jgi:predicted permease
LNLRWLRFGAKRSELADEIEAHLRMAAADKEADGVHAEEAQRQAQREFGNLALVKDVTREMWGWLWLERVAQDVSYAVRQFRRAPAFAVTVIGTLALGIGAATAMFTVVDHILLLPLPYAQADRLITIDVLNQRGDYALVSATNIEQWKNRSHTLVDIAAYRLQEDRNFLQGRDFSLPIDVVEGGAELFRTLGARPRLGSGFTVAESSAAIVLSDAAWRSAYGGDAAILGKTVTINHSSFTVAGVMPTGFRFPFRGQPVVGDIPQAWVRFDTHRTNSSFEIVAKLAPHATPDGAEAELNTMQKDLANGYAGLEVRDRPYSVGMHRYADTLVASDRKRALLILLAASVALWLIAAMNVTNLLLARSTARQREIAMRGALGASRWRVTQQLVVEGMLLSGAAGVLGVLLAVAAIRFSRSAIPIRLHVDLSYHVNATILAALCSITLLSGLLSSAWPAFLAARAPIEPSLRRGGQQVGRNLGQNRVRSLLVIAQISISLTLLVACGWLLRSIYLLRQVPLGFRTDHVAVVSLAIPAYKFEHRSITTDFYQPLLERVQHLPGVQAAGLLTRVPLSPGFAVETRLHDANNTDRRIEARFQVASAEIQRVLGFRMLRGRFFDSGDKATTEPVVVVNRAFAKVYGPNPQEPGSVLGRKFLVMNRWAKVVGVLDEERQESLTRTVQPEIVACISQLPMIGSDDGTAAVMEGISMDLALRTQSPLSSVIPELRAAMAQADLELTNADVMTMDQIVEDSYGDQRVAAHLLEVFGGVALLLCIAGIYGLLAYNVSQRTRELGVRLALGAPRSGVLWLVLRQTIALVVGGIALGVGLALASGRLVQNLLFGVSTNDAWTLAIVAGVLLTSALAAAWSPARRATSVNPVEALRAE